MALRELLAFFKIGVDTKPLQDLDKRIGTAKEGLRDFGTAVAGAFAVHAVAGFIESQIELGDHIADTAERLGVSIQEFQKFNYAVELTGGSADDAGTALRFLNKNVGEAISGNKTAAQSFAEMGVSVKEANGEVRPAMDIVADVADHFESLGSTAERTAAAMSIFGKGGSALVPLLSKGRKGVEVLAQEFDDLSLGLDDEFVLAADKASDGLLRVRKSTEALKSRLAAAMLPTVEYLIKGFLKASALLQKFTKQTYVLQTALIALGSVAAVKAAGAVVNLAKAFGLIQPGGILATIRAFLPIAGIAAAALLLYAIFDDLFTLMNGGESIIGQFLETMGGVEEKEAFVQSLRDAWDELNKSIDEMKPALVTVGQELAGFLPTAIKGFVILSKVVITVVESLLGLLEVATKLPKFSEMGSWDAWKKAGAEMGKTVDRIGNNIFGQTRATMDENGNFVQHSVGGIWGDAPMPANGKTDIMAKTTINVNGVGDPATVAKMTAAQIPAALSQADLRAAKGAVTSVGGR